MADAKVCVKCDEPILSPVLAPGEPELCANCGDVPDENGDSTTTDCCVQCGSLAPVAAPDRIICPVCGEVDRDLRIERVADALWDLLGGVDKAMNHCEPDAKGVLATVASFLSCLAEDIRNPDYVCHPNGTLSGLVNGIELTMSRVRPR